MRKLIFLLLLFFVFSHSFCQENVLRFNNNGEFKIVQFTDLHINIPGGKSDMVLDLMVDVINAEHPDLIILTGDIIMQGNTEDGWKRLINVLDGAKIPWSMVFGNHDHESELTHEEIVVLTRDCPYLFFDKGPDEVEGTGNFLLKIKSSTDERNQAILYFLDSHAKSKLDETKGYAWIDFSQITWYRNQSLKHQLPALAFFHIPLPEYKEAKNIIGELNEKICSPELNSGLFTTMLEMGDVMGTFAGHDHKNDFIGTHCGIALAYGRISGGENAYGKLERGARIIILEEGKKSFKTYIRLVSGDIINECKYPDSFN